MGQFAALNTRKINDFEDFNEVVGARRRVIQLEAGALQGSLSHARIDDLPVHVATCNLGTRTSDGSHSDRFAIGMLMGGRALRLSYESAPGDVLLIAPGCEHENRYYGSASLMVIMMSASDIEMSFASESRLSDPALWRTHHFRGNPVTSNSVISHLQALVARLGDASFTKPAAEFWKRAVIEAMTANIVAGTPPERDDPLPSALKVVRQVEEYLDACVSEPIHISQICNQIRVSRRTLHRAFHEVLGIGPIAFLRYRRLCAVHTMLRSNPHDPLLISDVALQYGFQNQGRFAGYYRQLFGEYPSETRQRHLR